MKTESSASTPPADDLAAYDKIADDFRKMPDDRKPSPLPADDVVEAATLAALRASCADVCSYAVNGAPGTGCYGECKRGDWGDDEIRNMRVAVKAALASAANLLRQSAPVEAPASPTNAAVKALVEWQPIETAPKDGTTILGVWWQDISDDHVVRPQVGICSWAGAWTPYNRKLTHWMPVPTAATLAQHGVK